MAGRILVLQHAPQSSLGAYRDVLDDRGDDTVWRRLHEGEPVPSDIGDFEAIISLGAPISVHDGGAPWLDGELELLRNAVEREVPVWGICFGAQALAAAMGARVWRGSRPEVGIRPLFKAPAADDDPVFAGLASSVPMFHWHGDSFDLPRDAVLLASSDAYPNQAFRVGTYAYGVQFHAEATPGLVRGWIDYPATAAQLESSDGRGAAERLFDESTLALPAVNGVARQLMRAWRDTSGAG